MTGSLLHFPPPMPYFFIYELIIFLSFFFFFKCGPFSKSLLNLFQYCFCFMFWFFGLKAYRILTPRPGVEPSAPALEG